MQIDLTLRRRPGVVTLALRALALLALIGPAACGGSDPSGAPPGSGSDAPSAAAGGERSGDEVVAAPDGAGARQEAPGAPRDGAGAGDEPLARILSTADRHDFGRVWQGAEVAHEFTFTAGGEVDLAIVDYRPDCGCTVAHLEVLRDDGTRAPYVKRTPVPPGTRFALAATFDTTNREGVQSKAVRIYANVPGGVRELTFRADIQPLLRIEPSTAVVERMSVLDRREAEFVVQGVTGDPFLLKPLRAGLPPELEVTVEPDPLSGTADGRAAHWRVRAVLQPGMPKGSRTYEILLETDLTTGPSPLGADGRPQPFVAKARIHAGIVGLVSVEPQNLNFAMVARDELVSRTVTLSSHDPGFELPEPTWEVKPYKEGASEAIADTLHVTTRRAENGSDWEIELLLEGLADAVPRSFLGRLVIRTGHPTERELEVVFSGLRRGS